jgi:hypothetical protein
VAQHHDVYDDDDDDDDDDDEIVYSGFKARSIVFKIRCV